MEVTDILAVISSGCMATIRDNLCPFIRLNELWTNSTEILFALIQYNISGNIGSELNFVFQVFVTKI